MSQIKLTEEEKAIINEELNRVVQSNPFHKGKIEGNLDLLELFLSWEADVQKHWHLDSLVISDYFQFLGIRDTVEDVLCSLSDELQKKVLLNLEWFDNIFKSKTIEKEGSIAPKINYKSAELAQQCFELRYEETEEQTYFFTTMSTAEKEFSRVFPENQDVIIDTPWATLSCPGWWHFRVPMKTKYACPCCGYKTLDLWPGYNGTCDICCWEDDMWQRENPDDITGCNHVSLRTAQQNFIKFGASDKDILKYVRKPLPTDEKDKDWKPLPAKPGTE